MFNAGQTVKFKPTSTWHPIYGETEFEILGNKLDSDGRPIKSMYDLRHETTEIYAHVDELDLVLPAIITTGIAAGVGNWLASTQTPVGEVAVRGAELGLNIAANVTAEVITAPAPVVETSWVDDILSTVGNTINTVTDAVPGIVSSAGDVACSVGDTIGSVASSVGEAACAVGEGLGAVASGVGEAIGGIADAL